MTTVMATRGTVLAGVASAIANGTMFRRSLSSGNLNVVPAIVQRGKSMRPTKDNEVSVVSYNVLCEKFATPTQFAHVPAPLLAYDYRWTILQRELAEFDADVICLQESTLERWDELRDYMRSLGYDCIQQLKPHEVKLAMFYKTARLQLGWWEERSRATLAELRLQTTNTTSTSSKEATRILYVVNVHLEAKPHRAADRVSQLRHALQRLRHHIESSANGELAPNALQTASIVVTGDFNSLESEAPCVFLREGVLPAGFIDGVDHAVSTKEDINHDFAFRDVYAAAHAAPPFTRKVDEGGARLDFMWCSESMGVAAVLRPLPEDLEIQRMVVERGLPNELMPSDHLPIGAVLQLKS